MKEGELASQCLLYFEQSATQKFAWLKKTRLQLHRRQQVRPTARSASSMLMADATAKNLSQTETQRSQQ